jgi:UDP-GlcNAc:undecaprenyl-phosphate GlcNAc-1-phosphate transferase
MFQYLIPLAMATLASLVFTPIVRHLAIRLGALDRPGERKVHIEPIPRLGGVALMLSLLITMTALQLFGVCNFSTLDLTTSLGILLGCLIVFVAGVWDDIQPLSAAMKFIFQASAALLAIELGVRIEQVSLLGSGTMELGFIAVPVTFLWIIGITNAFNLVDGLDGLAAGLASIAAGTCAVLFLLRGDTQDAILLLILVGALAGFLRYNFNPAKIFLGDSGSLGVGFLLATSAIRGSQKGATALAVFVPLLIFGLPILDTGLSMARRLLGALRVLQPYKASVKDHILASRQMFEPDQRHIHHRLIAVGLSHRNAVLAMYAIALGLSIMALISVYSQFRNAAIIVIAVGIATFIGIRKLGYEEIRFVKSGTLLRWYEELAFNRLFFLGFIDLILVSAAYWASFVLKYGVDSPPIIKEWHLNTFPLPMILQLLVFVAFGLYRGVWRAAGIGDVVRIVFAVTTAATLSYIVIELSLPPRGIFSFFCIDLLLLVTLIVGTRSAYRILDYADQRRNAIGSDTLIYGAGRGGQMVLRELLQNSKLGMRPIGFVDDSPQLQGRRLNQLPILGNLSQLERILRTSDVVSLIVSSSNINNAQLEKICHVCRKHGVIVLHGQLLFRPLEPALNEDLDLSSAAMTAGASYLERRHELRRFSDVKAFEAQ